MRQDELPGVMESLIPERPDTSGWGRTIRRRHRSRRVGSVAALALAIVVGVGFLTTNPPAKRPPIEASPAPVPPTSVPTTPTPPLEVPDACRVRADSTGSIADLEDVTGVYFCGPDSTDPRLYVQIPLSPALAADIVAEVGAAGLRAPEVPIFDAYLPSLVLFTDSGAARVFSGQPGTAYGWREDLYVHGNDGSLRHQWQQWEPSTEVRSHLIHEITAGDVCKLPAAPTTLTPQDVKVQVFSVGAHDAVVTAVVEHLARAGFDAVAAGPWQGQLPTEETPYVDGALLVGAEDDLLTHVGKWRWVQSWVPGEIAAAPMADGFLEPGVVAIWVGKGFDPGTLRIGPPEFLTRNVTCSDPAVQPTSR